METFECTAFRWTGIHIKELNEKIIKNVTIEKKLYDFKTRRDKLINRYSNIIKELEECQKKNQIYFQSIIDGYKNSEILSHLNLFDLEKKSNMINNENSTLELLVNETITKLTNENQDLTPKLEINETNALEIQEKLILEQKKLKKQIEKSNGQIKTISFLTADKDRVQEETDKLQKRSKECSLKSWEEKALICEKQYEELQTLKTNLVLNESQLKLTNSHQESKKELEDMDIKYIELKEKFIKQQIELVDYISKYNCQMKFITDLISERDNLINTIDALESTLLKKDNVIAANQEKLLEYEEMNDKVSLKNQRNELTVNHTNNEFNKAHSKLLILSKTQQKTIQHLKAVISSLKTEYDNKMTKVQRKTQEYVTSEYEMKFDQKRKQMKQFRQDFEAKLLKYKEKISKDKIHIKELYQQLWEVNEKYLWLQKKDKRESTMFLPFEKSTISEEVFFTLTRCTSLTLQHQKSSSASQITSLVEESTRCYQDNTERNVPAEIGKTFPVEENEGGEIIFNHSYLADLKQGSVRLNNNKKQSNEPSELQACNSLCPPRLRSCYAAETYLLPSTSLVSEKDIKTIANCSNYDTENLIPNDPTKEKDRNQTSYKKPGPPIPSKNEGCVSLLSNPKIKW